MTSGPSTDRLRKVNSILRIEMLIEDGLLLISQSTKTTKVSSFTVTVLALVDVHTDN